ncbi:TrkA family potassium uptake protein [Kamptonema cortianum]|nr:TrkA family potassium uptake protein [Geitlerinema splendidum]MDK3156356.1 TrkA family potassium uptake protein [Kamptonema cortianum]
MSLYVIVVGGGNVGFQLGKRLIRRGHEVVVLEKSGDRAGALCNLLGDEYVMVGDGCDLLIQKEAGFNRADVVVAVTGEDEDNLIACQLAKEIWNVGRVIARVNDPSHEEVFREIGIDDTVSATGIIFSLIDQQISSDELLPVGHLQKGQIEVVESLLGEKSPLIGRPLSEITLPIGTSIVYLMREGSGLEVSPETVFEAGDMIVAVVPTARAEELRAILIAKA